VLFRVPAVRWQAIAGLAAQVIQGAISVGVILVFRQHGRSLSLAGAVLAAFWIASAIARPIQGRLIDRHGPAELMVVCAVVNGSCVVAIVGLASAGGPGWSMIALGVVGGLGLAPVSTSMRVAWAGLGRGEPTAAYSLVYLTQELAILAGPLVFSGLLAATSASAALLGVVALATAGTLGFAASARAGGPSPSTSADRPPALSSPPTTTRRGALRFGSLRLMVLIAAMCGGVIGAVQIAAPTFAAAHHAQAAAGILIAALSVGGIIGAWFYGGRRWRLSAAARLVILLGVLTATVAIAGVADTVPVLGAFMFVAGLPLNPALTTLSLLVDRHIPTAATGEAFGWLSTGLAGGTGAGSVLAAALVQREHDPRVALVMAAVLGSAASAVTLATVRRLQDG
jgi:MFS family permease